MLSELHIGFIGGGNMGEALVKGLLTASLFSPERIHVFDVSPERTEHMKKVYHVGVCSGISEIAASCRIVVLAVKPQSMPSLLAELRRRLSAFHLVISIAAGVTLSTLSAGLPEGIPIVRVMPNTPALVLRGASAVSRGHSVSDEQMRMVLTIFNSVGRAVEVEEKWMDAVTGLSGSGPAYVLLLIESLTDAGVLMGLPRRIALELVLQTVIGAATLVAKTGKNPAELKDMIASPGGTTIAGLRALEDRAVRGAFMRAVEAATQRSEELGKGPKT